MATETWVRRQADNLRDVRRYVTSGSEAKEAQRRTWFFLAARRLTPMVAVDTELGRVMVSTSDEVIGLKTFVRRQVYDHETFTTILADLDVHRPDWRDDGAIVEVGANIGTTTLLLARQADVLAFEPMPANLKLLRHNVVANDLQNRVEVRGLAISDASGSIEIEINPHNHGDSRLRVEHREGSLGEHEWATVTVPTARLDDETDGRAVSLIFIDVQGHEAQVLAGAAKTLEAGASVVMKYWPYGLRRAGGLERLEDLIRRNFDTVIDTSDRRTGRAKTVRFDELEQLRERYARPEDHTDLILIKHPGR